MEKLTDADRRTLDAIGVHLMTRAGIEGQIRFFTNRISAYRVQQIFRKCDQHGNTYASLIAACNRQRDYWRRQLDELDTVESENASDTARMHDV